MGLVGISVGARRPRTVMTVRGLPRAPLTTVLRLLSCFAYGMAVPAADCNFWAAAAGVADPLATD